MLTIEQITILFARQLEAAKPFEESDFEPYDQLDPLGKQLIPDELVYEEYKKIRIGKKALFYMVDDLGMLKSAILKVYDIDLPELATMVKISEKAAPGGWTQPGGRLPRLKYTKDA